LIERTPIAVPPLSQIIRFDVFEVDLRAGELRKGGTKIRLQEQPFLILQMLLENPGQVVTREELTKKIWPGDTFVDFDHGLHAAVNRLRQALNDSADHPRFVETVARRGYRFVGQLQPTQLPAQLPTAPSPGADQSQKIAGISSRSWVGSLVGFLLAVALAAGLVSFNVWGLRSWLFGTRFHSLAVLPLANLTSDPKQDYFADGMTEDLTTQLSKLGDLKVISHTSVIQYKGTHKPLPEIARELNVDAVVTGAVELLEGRVRISAQLVDGRSDQHIWADNYDRELSNVLLLQSDVARDIAKKIDLELTPQQQQHLAKSAHPVNPEAYQAYLLGRYYWNKRTADGLAQAEKYFQQAIQKDPNYALAYSGLSDYFAFLTLLGGPEVLPPHTAMTQAKEAAVKGLQLDDSLAETHASMGHILHNYDWDFEGAEREFKRAIELNPNYATAHHWYSHYLMQLGRTEESLNEAKRAQELNPLEPSINNGLARQYYLSRQYDKAIAQCQIGLQIDPNYLPAAMQLALAYEQKGRVTEAVALLEKARGLAGTLPVVRALLAHAYATAGRRADAQRELNVLASMVTHNQYVPPSYLAIVSLSLGDKDKAFAFLQQSYQDRSEHMLYLGVEPLVDPLRSDPRFDALLKQIGLKH
jgi:TolB-like protein/DNA-binding winged helix-turn-helix (wHTH) protein/Flp pilus assembly protein TadD